MRTLMTSASLLALACGSSHPHSTADAPRSDAGSGSAALGDILELSGNRLVVEWWQADDGTRQFRGLYDMQLGFECTMFPAGDDGAVHCVGGNATQIGFTDLGCTQPAFTGIGSAMPTVAIDVAPGVCGNFVDQVTAIDPTPLAVYYQGGGGFCSGPLVSPTGVYAGSAATADVFVSATVQSEALPLSTTWLAGSDGTVVPATAGFDGLAFGTTILHAAGANFDCQVADIDPDVGAADGIACQLFTGPIGGVYADAACSVPAGGVNGCSDVPLVLPDPAKPSCDGHALLELGSAVTGELYAMGSNACAPSGGESDETYFAATAPFALPALAVEFGSAAGSARLATAYVTTAAGLHQHTDLYDTQLGVECSVQVASDGVARCLPTVAASALFSDPACTMAASGVELDNACSLAAMPPAPPFVVASGSAGIDAVLTVAPAMTTAYVQRGSACTSVPAYLAGSAVALDAFETATPILDH